MTRALCLEVLTDPRTLPCFHSFCKVCLEGVVQHRGRPIHMVTLNKIVVEKSWKCWGGGRMSQDPS